MEFVRDRLNGDKNETLQSDPVLSVACSLKYPLECCAITMDIYPARVDETKIISLNNHSQVYNAPVRSIPASPRLAVCRREAVTKNRSAFPGIRSKFTVKNARIAAVFAPFAGRYALQTARTKRPRIINS